MSNIINNNDYMIKIFKYFENIARKNNCNIIIIHCSGKSKNNNVLGATAIQVFCKQILVLEEINRKKLLFRVKQTKSIFTKPQNIVVQRYNNNTYSLPTTMTIATVSNPKVENSLNVLIKYCRDTWEKTETIYNRQDSNSITKLSVDWITTLGSDKRFSLQANYFLHALRNNTQYLAQNGVTWKNLGGRPNKIEITYTPSIIYIK